MIFDLSDNPEALERLTRLLRGESANTTRPKTASAFLETQRLTDVAYSCAVDGTICPECGGGEGLVIIVPNATVVGIAMPPSERIMVVAFDHHKGPRAAHMSAEQAKQLVNRLGEAIAIAERIDAEGATSE